MKNLTLHMQEKNKNLYKLLRFIQMPNNMN